MVVFNGWRDVLTVYCVFLPMVKLQDAFVCSIFDKTATIDRHDMSSKGLIISRHFVDIKMVDVALVIVEPRSGALNTEKVVVCVHIHWIDGII